MSKWAMKKFGIREGEDDDFGNGAAVGVGGEGSG